MPCHYSKLKLVGLMGPLVILCAYAYGAAPARADTPSQDSVAAGIFGDFSEDDNLDLNADGSVTAPDLVEVALIVFATPTNTPTWTATPTPTPTATPTATNTSTPTPIGLLFVGAVSDLVPHAVGDQLIYQVTDPMGKMTTETTMVISSDTNGAFVIDDKQVNGQQPPIKHETQSYTDTGTQLFFGGSTDVINQRQVICNPPLLRLMMPVFAGQVFSTQVRCTVRVGGIPFGFIDRTDGFTPIEVVDSLTVAAGTYTSVVHITGTTNLSGTVETDEIYLAPGVGPILQVSTACGQVTRHELTGGTVGGVSVNR